jgi:hypothetical protein
MGWIDPARRIVRSFPDPVLNLPEASKYSLQSDSPKDLSGPVLMK